MKKVYLLPRKIGKIAPEIYGQFTEHIGGVFYDGLWVGPDSDVPNVKGFRKFIVDKLKAINTPVIRWPGGCYAEVYDWRDGIGKNRPVRPNWWTYRDSRYESNAVGTHEFMDFCEAIGASAYFAANLTSSTPLQIRNWMDYCLSPKGSTTLALEREANGHPEPFNIPFWGVGNENWGGGGCMRPEFYADQCRRFAEVMNNTVTGTELFACGSDGDKFDWSRGVIPVLASAATNRISGFAIHYYAPNFDGDCKEFSTDEFYSLIERADYMEYIIGKNWSIICANDFDGACKLVIDEWGCWHRDGSGPTEGYNLFEQQSTMRDALVTAHTLNIFNRNADKIRMANVAQTVNNLHALFLASGDKCITTPTYHVFDLYKEHQGAEAIDVYVSENDSMREKISVSASQKNGETLVTVANLSCDKEAVFTLEGFDITKGITAKVRAIESDDVHNCNTFEEPDKISITEREIALSEPITIGKAGIVAIKF